MWKSVSGVFRVFDLAFFVPGAVALGMLPVLGWYNPGLSRVSAAEAVWLFPAVVVAVFVAGLLVHAATQWVWDVVIPSSRTSRTSVLAPRPWFSRLEKSERTELALYFWYLRGTCRNLATVSWVFVF